MIIAATISAVATIKPLQKKSPGYSFRMLKYSGADISATPAGMDASARRMAILKSVRIAPIYCVSPFVRESLANCRASTNTPMVADEAGFDRAKMIQPEILVPPLVWVVSDAARKVTGRRFLAVHWDTKLPPEQAAEKAGAPVAQISIATMPITQSRS
jgi:hypothetical protein